VTELLWEGVKEEIVSRKLWGVLLAKYTRNFEVLWTLCKPLGALPRGYSRVYTRFMAKILWCL